jgi:hypothetical protein
MTHPGNACHARAPVTDANVVVTNQPQCWFSKAALYFVGYVAFSSLVPSGVTS